jgi:hypothetical protein
VKPRAGFGDERSELTLDTIDHIVWRRRARGDAHGSCARDPFRSNIRLRLDVVHARTMMAAGVTSSRVLLLFSPPTTMTTSHWRARSMAAL